MAFTRKKAADFEIDTDKPKFGSIWENASQSFTQPHWQDWKKKSEMQTEE